MSPFQSQKLSHLNGEPTKEKFTTITAGTIISAASLSRKEKEKRPHLYT